MCVCVCICVRMCGVCVCDKGTVTRAVIQWLLFCRPEVKALSRKHEELVKKVNALMAKKAQ